MVTCNSLEYQLLTLFISFAFLAHGKVLPFGSHRDSCLVLETLEKQTHSFLYHSKLQIQAIIVGMCLVGRENSGWQKIPSRPYISLLLLPRLLSSLHEHMILLTHWVCDFPHAPRLINFAYAINSVGNVLFLSSMWAPTELSNLIKE